MPLTEDLEKHYSARIRENQSFTQALTTLLGVQHVLGIEYV